MNLTNLLVIWNNVLIYSSFTIVSSHPNIKNSLKLLNVISYYYFCMGVIVNLLGLYSFYQTDFNTICFIETLLLNGVFINGFDFVFGLFTYTYSYIKYKNYQTYLKSNSDPDDKFDQDVDVDVDESDSITSTSSENNEDENKEQYENLDNTIIEKKLTDECVSEIKTILSDIDERTIRLVIRTINKHLAD